jgi:release factor glutamine methyltransferase
MSSLQERIAEARHRLVRAGLTPADAALDAEVLARHALGWDRARLLTSGREPTPAGFDERFDALIERRAVREPVAFITGRREFWGLEFEVSPAVLIPRPETELIVEAACEMLPRRDRVRRIVDVGTGSGCLAVALAREFPASHVLAIDLSEAALEIARKNVATHAPGRVTLIRADLLHAAAGPVELIVANPPYVSSTVGLAPEIVRFEPAMALFAADHQGLDVLRKLIGSARPLLSDGGLFVVEFGFGQDDQVRALAAAAGWPSVAFKEDLQGIPRVAAMSA